MNDFEKMSAFIDSSRSAMIELQSVLTEKPALAPESGGNGEYEKSKILIDWLKKQGFTQLESFNALDSRVSSGIRPNLVVTLKGKNPHKAVWFMSHLDVVPAGEISLWQTDPFIAVEKDGKIFGRGVEDNQQGLVSSVFAALSCIKTGVIPEYTVKLLFVADEEVGSAYGIQYLLKNHSLFNTDDSIIIPDGGNATGDEIEIAEKNLLWLKITTKGKQTHGSRPDEGINAHLANCELALLLNKLEVDFDKRDDLFSPNRSTFQPTKKENNVPNINTIPGEDIFYMDCRILPDYSLNTVRTEITKRIALVEKKYGVSVVLEEQQAVESPATSKDAPVVQMLTKAIKRVYKTTAHPIGIGGGTVGAYLRNAGFDAVVWAKINETAHQPNEYCLLENLIGDAKVFASILCANQ